LIARGDLQRCLVVCPGSLAERHRQLSSLPLAEARRGE
jgi:hypothetical protein